MLPSIKNSIHDPKFFINEIRNFGHRLINFKRYVLSDLDSNHLIELRDRGWTSFNLNHLIDATAARKEMDNVFNQLQSELWIDIEGADNRLFGAENRMESANIFHQYIFKNPLLKAYMNMEHSFCTVMAGRIFPVENNTGSGGGWHRDSSEYNQVKAILYLSDVDQENGPFQYWEKTHIRSNYLNISKILGKNWQERRFSDEDISRSSLSNHYNLATITGNAGSVILADTSGIHRGAVVKKESRYALTEYIWSNRQVPPHIAKMIVAK